VVLEAFLVAWPSATSFLQLLASILRPPYPIDPSAWKVNSSEFAKKGPKNASSSQIHRRFIALCFSETRPLQGLCQGA